MAPTTSVSPEFEFPRLKEAQGKLDAARKELHDVFQEAGSDFDMDKVKSVEGDSKAKVEWIRTKNAEIEDLKVKADELWDIARAAQNSRGSGGGEPGSEPDGGDGDDAAKGGKPGHVKSLGELFAESQALKGYQGGQGPVATVEYDLKADFETGSGWAPESTRSGVVSGFPTRPAPQVVTFIPQAPINQASYKYMEETTFTNTAAETAEKGAYNEATLGLTERDQAVRKVTVWLPVTDEQLEDVPGARAYVDNRLTLMVRQRVDLQVIGGNGTAPNMLGTENVTGIQTQALGSDSIPDAAYKLFTQIREDGFAEPTVAFIRPSKWQDVQLLKTADGLYIWGHPSQAGPTTLWGVPIQQTTAVTSTKIISGDYQMHSLLSIRRGVDIQITNSHASNFVNGLLAIRADMRAVMVHFRPKAFGEVTGL